MEKYGVRYITQVFHEQYKSTVYVVKDIHLRISNAKSHRTAQKIMVQSESMVQVSYCIILIYSN